MRHTYLCAWTTKLLSEKPSHEFRAIHLTGATQEQQQQQQQQIVANNNNNNKSINQLNVVNFHALQVRGAVGQVHQSSIAQSQARCDAPFQLACSRRTAKNSVYCHAHASSGIARTARA